MARRFNGNSDFITFAMSSAVETLTAGNTTIVVVVKLNDVTDGALVHARQAGATGSVGNAWWMETFGGAWNFGQNITARQVGTVSSSDGWEVLIGRKAAGGSAFPRGRRIVLGGSTTDVTAGSTLADGVAPGSTGTLQVGKWGTVSEFVSADIAAVAVFASDLSDGTTATFTTYANILAASPAWCVAFDQANPTDPIDDDSATGTGDSNSITGTTIVSDPAGFFSGGPTGYTQNVSGSITPAATLGRQGNKLFAGSVTPAGALVRRAAKVFGGSITPAGTIATLKAALRSLAGSITPSGALTRRPGKALAGSVTPTGSVRKLTARTLAGTLIAAGALVKQAAKRLLGAIAPTGVLTTAEPDEIAKANSADAVLAYNSSTDTVLARASSVDAVTARNSSSGGVT